MRDIGILILGSLLTLAFYWSFFYLPRQRSIKKQRLYVETLDVGREVVTYGGIIGTIHNIEHASGIAEVEVADNVIVRVMVDALLLQQPQMEAVDESSESQIGEGA